VTPDGSAGPSGQAGFALEPGRYHLFIMEGCPWAHRTWLFHALMGLERAVSLSRTTPRLDPERGWLFDPDSELHRDPIANAASLREHYEASDPDFKGRVTVPVLWDKQRGVIVNNESSEIIRMFDDTFRPLAKRWLDAYPEDLREEIDALNARIYSNLNNGVYRAGFAGSQEAYEAAVADVFDTLDFLESRLATRRYLCGNRITEADWRLFPTLVRFDMAYVSAFLCNLRRLVDYPHLWAYTRDLYQQPFVAGTVRLEQYKNYHGIPIAVGHTKVVPKGPLLDFYEPHGRESLGGSGQDAMHA
jgi:putative glutathione S-transferase